MSNALSDGWGRMAQRRSAPALVALGCVAAVLFLLLGPAARSEEPRIAATVNVTVDMSKAYNFLAPRAPGIHASVSDNHLMDPQVPALLKGAGITTLRYPGGGYADLYQWSTHTLTKWQGSDPPKYGYLAPKSDFGNFVSLVDRIGGTAIIAVNYGSNLAGTGGGEPAEAAAWVAYTNGDLSDPRVIGKDSTGYDWKTVGYWASLRASRPLEIDDGKNFLRIARPQPILIRYWEVGNEVFLNGYYGGEGREEDLHAPYPKDPKDNEKHRMRNPKLSPEAYGKGILEFAQAMKAVDPRIKIGAALDTPLAGGGWKEVWTEDSPGTWRQHYQFEQGSISAVDWNNGVLKVAGKHIDFVVLHWYAGNLLPPQWKELDNVSFLAAPHTELPKIMEALLALLRKHCGENAPNIQLAVTELGARPHARLTDPHVNALFAADAYASLITDGAVNIDWLDLHNSSFLDDNNTPGPAYYGIQMVRILASLNDKFVATQSSHNLLAAHAVKRADGGLGLMLINKDPKNSTQVKVKITGGQLGATGMRFDYGPSNPPSGNTVSRSPLTDVGDTFTLTVPAYTVTGLVIPKLQ